MSLEEVNVEPTEPTASIGFQIPEDISQNSIEIFIKESANISGATINALIERANKNPDGFLNALRLWEDKNSKEEMMAIA